MGEKVTDYRITQITDYFFKIYEEKYGRKPMWSGKEAKLLQTMLKSYDSRKMDVKQLYASLDGFMKDEGFAKQQVHAFAIFALNPDKYLPKVETPEEKGQRMVDKAKEVFSIDEVLTVRTITDDELLKQMAVTYPCNSEGCRRWVKGQKFIITTLDPKPGSKAHNNWLLQGKLAKIYFGTEMVVRFWKENDPNASKEAHVEKVKKQAQILLTQEKKEL